MFCSNCGNQIPEGTKFCGHCGAPVAAPASVTGTPAQPATPASVPQEYVPTYSHIPEEPVKKKPKVGLIAGIAIGLVAVIAIVVGVVKFAGKNFEHSIHKTFDEPKEYYSYVEKKNIDAMTEGLGSDAVQTLVEQVKAQNFSMTETVKLRLGSRGKDYTAIAGAMGVDLSWLDSVGIQYSGSVNENLYGLFLTPILNDVNLLDLICVLDVEKGAVYASIPDVSEKYLGASFGDEADYDMIKERFAEMYDVYGKMFEACPSPEKAGEMVQKYYNVIMENVDEVEKSKETLEAGDVMEECTLLTIELKEKDIQRILKAILQELKKDEDVKKMIMDMEESMKSYVNEYGDEESMYDQFLEGIDEALENIEEVKIDKIVIENYVNKDGNIVGRKLTVKVDDETTTFTYAIATKGDDKGYEYSVKGKSEEFSIIGNGKEKNGKLNAEFVLSASKKKYVNFVVEDFEVDAVKDGRFAGTFVIKPGRDADLTDVIEELADSMDDSPFATLVSGMKPSLKVVCDIQTTQHNIELTLLDDGAEMFTLSFQGTLGEAKSVSVPGSYVDLKGADGEFNREAFVEYVKGLNYDNVINALERANLPSEWITLLNQYKTLVPQLIEYKMH